LDHAYTGHAGAAAASVDERARELASRVDGYRGPRFGDVNGWREVWLLLVGWQKMSIEGLRRRTLSVGACRLPVEVSPAIGIGPLEVFIHGRA